MALRQIKEECRSIPWILLSATLVFSAVSRVNAQQSQPALEITSPTDGTVVNTGQSLSITVISPTNTTVSTVSVIGEDPVGTTNPSSSLPAQLSLTIPANISLRKYALTAVAGTSSGQVLYSDRITIDVERPDLPTRLSSLRPRMTFTGINGPLPLTILATFSDGSYLDVTESSNLRFLSSNTAVATVDANGMVTRVAQGTATITATYAVGNQTVSVSVPVTVPKPTVTPSSSAVNFGSQNVGTSSQRQTLTLTNTWMAVCKERAEPNTLQERSHNLTPHFKP